MSFLTALGRFGLGRSTVGRWFDFGPFVLIKTGLHAFAAISFHTWRFPGQREIGTYG